MNNGLEKCCSGHGLFLKVLIYNHKENEENHLDSWSSDRNLNEHLPDKSEMCQTCEPSWPIPVATACQIQGCGVQLAQTMARDHIRDSRTHNASHREHLLPLYDHLDHNRHAPGHDGRTPVSC